jgi:hypothetical protein
MNVNVSFPEELLVALKEDRKTFSRKVTVYTLGHLYEQGKISSGIGAKVLVTVHRSMSANKGRQ